MTLAERLKKGVINQEEHDVLKQAEADKVEADKAQEWKTRFDAAPLQRKRQMIKEQAVNMSVEAALMDDRFEAKAKQKKAWNLRKALRGAGGISF